MRYILLPIHPEWCCKLMNGDKETEVRRGTTLYKVINNLIKEQGKAPCLIYCTKEKNKFDTLIPDGENYLYGCPYDNFHYLKVNGKVVAQFEAKAEIISLEEQGDDDFGCEPWFYETATLNQDELLERSCLCEADLDEYLEGKDGTAIHIHNLKIFDKPKELKELNKVGAPTYGEIEAVLGGRYTKEQHENYLATFGYAVAKAPQSWCYCEVEE